jgi:hypothetical protein
MLDRGNDPGASFIFIYRRIQHLRFCLSSVIIFEILILEGTARKLLPSFFILCKKSNPDYPYSVKWARNPDSTECMWIMRREPTH